MEVLTLSLFRVFLLDVQAFLQAQESPSLKSAEWLPVFRCMMIFWRIWADESSSTVLQDQIWKKNKVLFLLLIVFSGKRYFPVLHDLCIVWSWVVDSLDYSLGIWYSELSSSTQTSQLIQQSFGMENKEICRKE
jgi:hypothetical protein